MKKQLKEVYIVTGMYNGETYIESVFYTENDAEEYIRVLGLNGDYYRIEPHILKGKDNLNWFKFMKYVVSNNIAIDRRNVITEFSKYLHDNDPNVHKQDGKYYTVVSENIFIKLFKRILGDD